MVGAQRRSMQWSMATVLVCLALVVASWFLLIEPRRSTISDLVAQEVTAQEANAALRTRIEELRVQFGKLPETRAKLAEIRRQLPATADVPALVRTVDSLASVTGVTLLSITPDTAESVGKGAGQRGQTSAEPPAAPSSAPSAASSTSATTSSKDELVAIPVSVVVSGDYYQAVSFLRQLQTGQVRAFLVTGLEIGESSEDSSAGIIQMTVNGRVFSRLDPAAAAASPSPTPPDVPAAAGSPVPTRSTTPGTPVPPPTAPVTSSPAPAASGQPIAAGAPSGVASGGQRW